MKTIFKYEVRVFNEVFEIYVPNNFQPIAFQSQKNMDGLEVPTLWAIVDPDSALESKRFLCIGTGVPFPKGVLSETRFRADWESTFDYIGTAQAQGFVWHLFWKEYDA